MSKILKNCVIVKELQDDMIIDGLLTKYDDSSPYMYGKVIDGNQKLLDDLSTYTGSLAYTVISFFRVNKTPYEGKYLVDGDNIIEVMTLDEYNKRKGGNS